MHIYIIMYVYMHVCVINVLYINIHKFTHDKVLYVHSYFRRELKSHYVLMIIQMLLLVFCKHNPSMLLLKMLIERLKHR